MDLKEKLLSIGGKSVLMPEAVPEVIDDYGHLYELDVVIAEEGTSEYFRQYEDELRVMWGLVLDSDDVWKLHSWLVSKATREIIDKVKYKAYYGFTKTETL